MPERNWYDRGRVQAAFEHFAHVRMGGRLPPRTRNAVGYELAELGVTWPFLSKLCQMTDDEVLALPGVGRDGLRAVRRIAPYWGPRPHRDRLRPPRPKERHPWWLLP
jgi:hypothetical protein